MIEYGYINENGCLVSKIIEEQVQQRMNENGEVISSVISIQEQVEQYISLGWKPVDLIDESKLDSGKEFLSVKIQPFDNDDRISYQYIEYTDNRLIEKAIESLKDKLSGSDYQVTKCNESLLVNLPLPYDIVSLHQERQKLRNRINELENLIKE